MRSALDSTRQSTTGYRHEAFLYASDDEYLAGTVPFIADALAHDEPVMVMVPPPRIDLLRRALDGDADRVHFKDMTETGRNPGRIIPEWAQFLADHATAGRPLRGIGEPVWAGRTPAELSECQQHEALLNIALPADVPFWLRCPYDVAALAPEVIAEAERTHPELADANEHWSSTRYREVDELALFRVPLPEPSQPLLEIDFGAGELSTLRRSVRSWALDAGLGDDRTDDLVLAVSEVATNSVSHGGGSGTLRAWDDGLALVCEVHDEGQIPEPLIGRRRPSLEGFGGRGLWLANLLCDLVQLRSPKDGLVLRLHMRLEPPVMPAAD